MNRSLLFRLPLFALLACHAAIAGDALPVKPVNVEIKNKLYDITLAYPHTGLKPIDDDLAAVAQKTMADFKSESAEVRQPQDGQYSLQLAYKIVRNDGAMFDVVFTSDYYMDGAHPGQDYITANYLRPDGWRVYLPEILDGEKGFARLSRLEIADLDRQLLGPDAMSDKDWIARGAGPEPANFADFAWLADALVIYYPPYNVAAYAAGPQQSRVALSGLRDVMRKDWRAPAASFDCAAAATATERALCSDVPLARLDREVAQDYARQMDEESDAAKKPALRAAQRAWLARRDWACAGQTGRGEIACLTGFYKERAAALAHQP
jgi:uncharacterized protein YecT (DUF1311 family)